MNAAAADARPQRGSLPRRGAAPQDSPVTARWTPYSPTAATPYGDTDARVRVYCLPHAGGAAQVYLPWRATAAEAGLDIVPVELPGHGTRYCEPPLTRMRQVVDGLLSVITSCPGEEPFVLFGHSMGARVAYETALRLVEERLPLPLALVVSGNCPGRQSALPVGTDDALLRWMLALGGTPAPALSHKAVARAVVRTLRADLDVLDGHHTPRPLPCPILALAGTHDEIAPARAVANWRPLASAHFRHEVLPGDHFFPHAQPERVVAEIRAMVATCRNRKVLEAR